MMQYAALNVSANLENSAVSKGLEKFSFHSNPRRQGQTMFKLSYDSWKKTLMQGTVEGKRRDDRG